jgi:hypothetical protein
MSVIVDKMNGFQLEVLLAKKRGKKKKETLRSDTKERRERLKENRTISSWVDIHKTFYTNS